MTEFTLLLFRLAFLAVLWFFVIAAVGVIRSDIFGPRTAGAGAGRRSLRKDAHRPVRAPARPRRGEPRQLVVTAGALSGTKIDLGDSQITMGRANDSTLVLTDDYASSRHARIFSQEGQWFVEDLGSTNGTYLDRTRITRPTPVMLGVPIRIGKTVIELRK